MDPDLGSENRWHPSHGHEGCSAIVTAAAMSSAWDWHACQSRPTPRSGLASRSRLLGSVCTAPDPSVRPCRTRRASPSSPHHRPSRPRDTCVTCLRTASRCKSLLRACVANQPRREPPPRRCGGRLVPCGLSWPRRGHADKPVVALPALSPGSPSPHGGRDAAVSSSLPGGRALSAPGRVHRRVRGHAGPVPDAALPSPAQ